MLKSGFPFASKRLEVEGEVSIRNYINQLKYSGICQQKLEFFFYGNLNI